MLTSPGQGHPTAVHKRCTPDAHRMPTLEPVVHHLCIRCAPRVHNPKSRRGGVRLVFLGCRVSRAVFVSGSGQPGEPRRAAERVGDGVVPVEDAVVRVSTSQLAGRVSAMFLSFRLLICAPALHAAGKVLGCNIYSIRQCPSLGYSPHALKGASQRSAAGRPARVSVGETTAVRPACRQSLWARWRTMAAGMLAVKTLRFQPDPALIRLT